MSQTQGNLPVFPGLFLSIISFAASAASVLPLSMERFILLLYFSVIYLWESHRLTQKYVLGVLVAINNTQWGRKINRQGKKKDEFYWGYVKFKKKGKSRKCHW